MAYPARPRSSANSRSHGVCRGEAGRTLVARPSHVALAVSRGSSHPPSPAGRAWGGPRKECGCRESNPEVHLGKVPGCRYLTTAWPCDQPLRHPDRDARGAQDLQDSSSALQPYHQSAGYARSVHVRGIEPRDTRLSDGRRQPASSTCWGDRRDSNPRTRGSQPRAAHRRCCDHLGAGRRIRTFLALRHRVYSPAAVPSRVTSVWSGHAWSRTRAVRVSTGCSASRASCPSCGRWRDRTPAGVTQTSG